MMRKIRMKIIDGIDKSVLFFRGKKFKKSKKVQNCKARFPDSCNNIHRTTGYWHHRNLINKRESSARCSLPVNNLTIR